MNKYLILCFWCFSLAQGTEGDSSWVVPQDSLYGINPDTMEVSSTGDNDAGSAHLSNISSVRSGEAESDSVKVVRHQFNHREQVIVGGVIMACIALVLVTMNNYNPR